MIKFVFYFLVALFVVSCAASKAVDRDISGSRESQLEIRERELKEREAKLRTQESNLAIQKAAANILCQFDTDCDKKDNCVYRKCEKSGAVCTFDSDCLVKGKCAFETKFINGEKVNMSACKQP